MAGKAQRRTAQEAVSAYHEAQLGTLAEHVATAVDRYRAGEIDAYDLDETLHHYHRAARKLWTFCWSGGVGTNIEIVADTIERLASANDTIDWWERGTPRQR